MDDEKFAQLKKLSPFAVRAGIAETGRQRLLQHRNKLAFLLITEDISENSRDEVIRDFACPVYQALTMELVGELFGFKGTKIIGFRRNVLSTQIQRLVQEGHIVVKPLMETTLPERPRVAIFGAGDAGRKHAALWKSSGCEVVSFLERDEESGQAAEVALEAILGYSPAGYISPESLIQETTPDIVDVCLPTELHFAGCHLALRLGCHILCETPFLDAETLSPKELRRRSEALVSLAARRKRLFGLANHIEDAIRGFAQGKVFFQAGATQENCDKSGQ